MKTITTSLPVYDKLSKQCYQKAKKQANNKPVPIVCPRHRLPSMLWNVESDNPGGIINMTLVDKDGNETDITEYFISDLNINLLWAAPLNSGYDSFTPDPSGYLFEAIKTTAAGVAYVYTDSFAVTAGEILCVRTLLTLASGTSPKMVIVNNAGTDISNIITLTDAVYTYIYFPITETDAAARIRIRNLDTELTNYQLEFLVSRTENIPELYTELTDEYFQYKGGTISAPPAWGFLPVGIYYLKMTTVNDYIYYSDWFEITCVYDNLITAWTNTGGYDTFTTSGTTITSAIEAGVNPDATSNNFNVTKGESIKVYLYLITNSGELPYLRIQTDATYSNIVHLVSGLNEITFITADEGNAYMMIYNTTATNFSTSEILVNRLFSEKYLTINFSNVCDLGDILYADGFEQTIWFESETMESSFPQEEQGVNNGNGQFVRSFARQVKKYIARTMRMPAFMVEVFNRMKLHDTVEIIDLVGDVNNIYDLEVDHEWLDNDKYYAKIDLTFDYNEAFVIAGCCNNLT